MIVVGMEIRIPISPSIRLMAHKLNLTLDFQQVAQLNAFHLSRAHSYTFARDFDLAQVYRRKAVGLVIRLDLGEGLWLRRRTGNNGETFR